MNFVTVTAVVQNIPNFVNWGGTAVSVYGVTNEKPGSVILSVVRY